MATVTMWKQHTTDAAIDMPFGTNAPIELAVSAELPSCHSGVDVPLAAAEAVSRGSLAAVAYLGALGDAPTLLGPQFFEQAYTLLLRTP